jgi:N-alpha-acetyltransferase 40
MAPPSGRASTIVALADRASLPPSFEQNGHKIEFTKKLPASVSSSQLLELTRNNMRTYYDNAGDAEWKWDDEKKNSELRNSKNIFVLLTDPSGALIGFCVFRFLVDNTVPVVYVWELQLEAAAQGKGWGRVLMTAVESFMKEKTGVRKVMLTVLVGNTAAVAFYRKLGYIPEFQNKTYLIMKR